MSGSAAAVSASAYTIYSEMPTLVHLDTDMFTPVLQLGPKRRYVYIWTHHICEDCGSTAACRPGICLGNESGFLCELCQQSMPVAWELDQREMALPSRPIQLHNEASDSEANLRKHPKHPVAKTHIELRGKYRAICKLFITFEGATKQATGWCCLEKGIIATGGHCVYDEEYGQAIAIEAHISYHGADSDLRKTHEVRMATYVAVHRGWYDKYLRQNDIALIRLQSPFDEVLPLNWKDCPVKGEKMTICVVGYPLDEPGGREGQYMYESTGDADWDLEQHAMLTHQLDTFPGNSGSPVFHIEDQELVVVGVQVCTGKIPRPTHDGRGSSKTGRLCRVNKAVAIGYKGNSLDQLRQAINRIMPLPRCSYCRTTKRQIR